MDTSGEAARRLLSRNLSEISANLSAVDFLTLSGLILPGAA